MPSGARPFSCWNGSANQAHLPRHQTIGSSSKTALALWKPEAMYRFLRIGPWPNSTIRSSPAVRSTSLDTVKRMSSLWSCCCRYVCALPVRLQSPRHSFLGTHLCESAHSELVRIGHLKECLLDMDGVHIGANLGLRVAYRCLHRQLHDVPSVTARS